MTPNWQTNLPRYGDRVFDVVVVGSGSAGSTAAIAAARGGADTLLVEKLPFLGGVSTAVLDTFYGFYTPGTASRKVVGGIADDVVGALRDLGPVVERPNTFGAGTGVTYHPDHLKVVWERLVLEAGAGVLLHAFVQDVAVHDGRVEALIVATKSGLQWIAGRTFVDASGDADLCHFAGFGYELAGELEPAQTLTTTFRVANVDLERRGTLSKSALNALMAEASSSGAYDMPRREGSDHVDAGRRRDRDDHDPPRIVPSRRRSGGQRDRSGLPDRGRDRRPAPGARVRPVSDRSGPRVRACQPRRRSGRRSAFARRAACTATTG